MKFSKIIGGKAEWADDEEIRAIVKRCEEKITTAFMELSTKYSIRGEQSKIGGDPFIFQLIYPMRHICDLSAVYLERIKEKEKAIKARAEEGASLPEDEAELAAGKAFRAALGGRVLTTAATNGTSIFYSPLFINKLSRTGVRFILQHEALHAALAHPERRGNRLPHLYNVSIDFKVDFLILEYLAFRGIPNYEALFKSELGDYITMDEYAQWLRNPFDPPAKMAHLNPMHSMKKSVDPGYQHPADNHPPLYFSDANLQGDMRRPEFIYSHLLSQIPKCKVCGKLGKYEKPDEYKELERHLRAKEDAEKAACIDKNCDKHDHSPEHTHTDDCKDKCTHQQCDCEKDGGDYYNGGGDLVDDHYDFDISEDEMGKRLQNAVDQSRRLGGKVGAGIEDELDALISPKLSYKDFILSKLHNIRTGSGRCDWSSPKTKPLFLGVYQPKRVNRFAKFVCLVDTSGSMGSDDLVLGISQIQSLDSRGEGTIACFDTKFYPESVVKLRSANATELSKTKIIGRGGSMITDALKRYEEYCGKPNLLIIISDSGLVESIDEINAALPTKGTEVMWLITQPNKAFKPNGRVFHLRD